MEDYFVANMRKMSSFLLYVGTFVLLVSSSVAKVIDLSHKHGPKTLMSLHGALGYNLTNLYRGSDALGVYVELNYYGSSEHGGTHIDAPSHFTPGGMTLDEVPIESTIADGVMLDFSREAAANHSYTVNIQQLLDWERKYGEIPRDAAVLFYFGWYQKFDNEVLYRGTNDLGNGVTYVYPYLDVDAARWLLEKRRLRTIGSDTLSVDPFQINGKHSAFPIHILLLPKNRTIIENLRDLDKLPPRGFRFHAAPVKYVGASGAQVRAYAIVTPEGEGNSAVIANMSSAVVLCLTVLLQIIM